MKNKFKATIKKNIDLIDVYKQKEDKRRYSFHSTVTMLDQMNNYPAPVKTEIVKQSRQEFLRTVTPRSKTE